MEDFGDLAFECVLQPSVLDAKVFQQSPYDPRGKTVANGVLRELLTQLQTMSKPQFQVRPDIGNIIYFLI
jgi:hypothetical protein